MKFTRIAFLTAVTFLVLKLCGVVDWSWGYIVIPFAWFMGAMSREVEIEQATGKKVDVGI